MFTGLSGGLGDGLRVRGFGVARLGFRIFGFPSFQTPYSEVHG